LEPDGPDVSPVQWIVVSRPWGPRPKRELLFASESEPEARRYRDACQVLFDHAPAFALWKAELHQVRRL
jgi:hypothetical protein